MFSKVTVTLIVLLALFALSSSKENKIRMCSDMLNNVLSQMCEETGFNGVMKRGAFSSYDLIDPIQYIEAKETADVLPYPLANGRMRNVYRNNVINSLTATRRHSREGIIEECCMRSCTMGELSTYCNAPA
ncbi:probable insulin-like peptide 2 [Drosophila busckii]|uniref:probable insulin-like peptide 2 n=1 Tax=Drosophila busckii TaxID=30019 RepID=UPI00083EFCFE|nr:probable insulin-like peptide 2 [Drosophila busckii]